MLIKFAYEYPLYLISSSMTFRAIAHLTSEEMLRAFHRDMSICLVHINRRSEAFSNFLCKTNLLLWHKFVG